MRINKFLSQAGIASRRAADSMIEDGLVLINGSKASLGAKLKAEDQITIKFKNNNEELTLIYTEEIQEKIYLIYNKARGITCTCSKEDPSNIIDEINFPKRIYPIGRLDKDSQGLILLTNDGEFAYKLSHPKFEHEKEYLVCTKEKITDEFIKKMSEGIELEEKKTSACQVERISDHQFKIILHEGLNRQIRRMCEELGYRVEKLIRIRIANIALEPEENKPKKPLSEKSCKQKIKINNSKNIHYFSIPEGNYVRIYMD